MLTEKPPNAREAATKYELVKKDCPEKIEPEQLCRMAEAYDSYDEKKSKEFCKKFVSNDCKACQESIHGENHDIGPFENYSSVGKSIQVLIITIASPEMIHYNPQVNMSLPIAMNHSLYRNSSPPVIIVNPAITWNFESGFLRGWNRSGNAFDHQPVQRGKTVTPKTRSFAGEGNFWVTSYEMNSGLSSANVTANVTGDIPTGTLESLPFIVRGESISFLQGGGRNCSVDLRVDDEIVLTAIGNDTDTMRRVTWNVTSLKGKEAVLLVVDNSTERWGHVNFDDVRFDIAPMVLAFRK